MFGTARIPHRSGDAHFAGAREGSFSASARPPLPTYQAQNPFSLLLLLPLPTRVYFLPIFSEHRSLFNGAGERRLPAFYRLRCFGARRVLRSGAESNSGFMSCPVGGTLFSPSGRRAFASRAPVGSKTGLLGYARICSSIAAVRNSITPFAREPLPSVNEPVFTRRDSILRRLEGHPFDRSSSVMGSGHLRELHMLYRVRSFASTSASDMAGSKPVGATEKQVKKDIVKKGKADGEIPDSKILYSLVKYLWLKDSLEFRLRVVMALLLLVGAKVRILVPWEHL
ncbi:hypothetical protein Taro_023540 [Colocasia esculenta]|uniref:Uncharacterized protein n=1 Tax=Colocasia esculenta TaxID=4460 RepID=A0A843VBP2_COLES|nr:hypothetical protein [Colocasia esculenta]